MPYHVKDGGVWKEGQAKWVKDGGVWKEVQNGYIKDAGIWKPFYESVFLWPYNGGFETYDPNASNSRKKFPQWDIGGGDGDSSGIALDTLEQVTNATEGTYAARGYQSSSSTDLTYISFKDSPENSADQNFDFGPYNELIMDVIVAPSDYKEVKLFLWGDDGISTTYTGPVGLDTSIDISASNTVGYIRAIEFHQNTKGNEIEVVLDNIRLA